MKSKWLSLLISIFTSLSYGLEPGLYLITHGDTLSTIAQKHLGSPVYPERHGSLDQLLALNPWASRNTIIYPGQILRLKDSARSLASDVKSEIKIEAQSDTTAAVSSFKQSEKTQQIASAEAIPLAQPNSTQNQKSVISDVGSYFGISVNSRYSALTGVEKSNNTKGNLLSNLNYGAKIWWKQDWGDTWKTGVYFKLQQVSLSPESHGTKLYDDSKNLSSFGFNMSQDYSSSLSIDYAIEQGSKLFYRGSLSSSGLELNIVPLTQVHADLKSVIKKRGPLSAGVVLGLSYDHSGSFDNYSIDPGFEFRLGVFLNHRFQSGSNLNCKGLYEQRNQNTSLLILSEKIVGLSCGYDWWVR